MSAGAAPDPLYVASRRVLLDALDALRVHHRSIVVVGAQAVYLRTTGATLTGAPFTRDADIAIDPEHLTENPALETAMEEGGFRLRVGQVGSWTRDTPLGTGVVPVEIDLMVPSSLAGAGRRAPRGANDRAPPRRGPASAGIGGRARRPRSHADPRPGGG